MIIAFNMNYYCTKRVSFMFSPRLLKPKIRQKHFYYYYYSNCLLSFYNVNTVYYSNDKIVGDYLSVYY